MGSTIFSAAAFAAILVCVGVLGYLIGRAAGRRAERRHWQRRVADQARELGRTRDIIHRALQKDGEQ